MLIAVCLSPPSTPILFCFPSPDPARPDKSFLYPPLPPSPPQAYLHAAVKSWRQRLGKQRLGFCLVPGALPLWPPPAPAKLNVTSPPLSPQPEAAAAALLMILHSPWGRTARIPPARHGTCRPAHSPLRVLTRSHGSMGLQFPSPLSWCRRSPRLPHLSCCQRQAWCLAAAATRTTLYNFPSSARLRRTRSHGYSSCAFSVPLLHTPPSITFPAPCVRLHLRAHVFQVTGHPMPGSDAPF